MWAIGQVYLATKQIFRSEVVLCLFCSFLLIYFVAG